MPAVATGFRDDDPAVVAAELGKLISGGVAALVFGSRARGTDITPLSDVDILVLVRDRAAVTGLRDLAAASSPLEISLVVHDERSLSILRRRDWSFVEHLKREHIPAFGDVERLTSMLQPQMPRSTAIRAEISRHADAVDLLRPDLLGGRHLVAYGHLYAAAKSAAILDSLVHDDVTFDRRRALEGVAARNPDLIEAVERVERLEPFWLRLRRTQPVALPWSPRRDHARLSSSLSAVRVLLRHLAKPR